MTELTAEALRQSLHYSIVTGVFTRIASRRGFDKGTTAGSVTNDGRVAIRTGGKSYLAHRLAWLWVTGDWPKGVIDHENTNPLQNQWINLRDVTQSVNLQNQRKARRDNSCGFLGVHKSPCSKSFIANIRVLGRLQYLGSFATPEAAHAAYISAKRVMHPGCTI